jgi:hypothetical protein
VQCAPHQKYPVSDHVLILVITSLIVCSVGLILSMEDGLIFVKLHSCKWNSKLPLILKKNKCSACSTTNEYKTLNFLHAVSIARLMKHSECNITVYSSLNVLCAVLRMSTPHLRQEKWKCVL